MTFNVFCVFKLLGSGRLFLRSRLFFTHVRGVFRIGRTVEIAGPLTDGGFVFTEVLFLGPCVVFAAAAAFATVTAAATLVAVIAISTVAAAASTTTVAVVIASAFAPFTSLSIAAVEDSLKFRTMEADFLRAFVAAGFKLMRKQFRDDDEQVLIDGKRLHLIEDVHVQFVVMDIMEDLLEALFRDLRAGGNQSVLQLGADVPSDGVQLSHFTRRHKRDGRTALAGAARPPDAMDIAAGIEGKVVVEDMGDIVDVKAAGRHVRGDENVDFAAAEGRHDAGALSLLHVAMEAVDVVSSGGQEDVQRIRFLLRAAEDHAFGYVFRVNQTDDGVSAFMVFDDVEKLFDVIVRAFRNGCRDVHGILENVLRKLDDGTRHRGGEKHGLVFAVEMFEDLFDVVKEAHVQHFIRFVYDDVLGIDVVEMAGVDQVEKAPGRGDQRVDSLGEHGFLTAVGLAAREGRRMDVGVASELEQFVGDLRGKFACRNEHEQIEARFVHDLLHGREAEGGGLARAGEGLADDVATFHDTRDGLHLDGRRFAEARFVEGLHDFRAEAEGIKGDDGLFFCDRFQIVFLLDGFVRCFIVRHFWLMFRSFFGGWISRHTGSLLFRIVFLLFFRIFRADGVVKREDAVVLR